MGKKKHVSNKNFMNKFMIKHEENPAKRKLMDMNKSIRKTGNIKK